MQLNKQGLKKDSLIIVFDGNGLSHNVSPMH